MEMHSYDNRNKKITNKEFDYLNMFLRLEGIR